jgi:hypothetical protein
MATNKRPCVKVVLTIAVLVCLLTVAIGLSVLQNWFSHDFQNEKRSPDEKNRATEIASMNYDVKKRLNEYMSEGYSIENFTEHLYQARYQVIFQASKMDNQGRLLSASLVVALVDVDSESVLDLKSFLSYFTMEMATQRSEMAKVVQVFLEEFPDAECSVGFKQDGPMWVIAWKSQGRTVRILFDMHGWIQDVVLVQWDVERPEIVVNWVEAVEISRRTETVQRYLDQHPDATFNLGKLYVENLTVFYVSEDWIVLTIAGGPVPKKVSGVLEGNYCWNIHWYDPQSLIPHIVNVFVDVETGEVLSVTEAW